MADEYSRLEVAPNEHTHQSPELHGGHDNAANAPELDPANDSPELDKDKKIWPPPVSICAF